MSQAAIIQSAGAGAKPPSSEGPVAQLVTRQVIPRLLMACRSNAEPRRPSRTHVETLARLALSRDPGAAAAHVGALRDAGLDQEALLVDLLGPAAARLGDFWSCDSADFAEVAIGASRLVQIARDIGVEAERALEVDAPRAMIASPEAERHGLGAHIVAQYFRAAGWRVTLAPGETESALAEIAASEHYDMIGLSVGSERAATGLDQLVARLRAASRNRRAAIALGGYIFGREPRRAADLGADFVASNPREAIILTREHLSRAARAVQ